MYNCIIKLLGTPGSSDCLIRVIRFKSFRDNHADDDSFEFFHYDSKLDESISRARSKIFELAFCNPWDYFFTGTLDPSKYSRFDLDKFHHDLTKWLKNWGSYRGLDIKFLLVPEPHEDGAWHIHGFLYGIPSSYLHHFNLSDHLPYFILNRLRLGFDVSEIPEYRKKFGWCTLEPVRSHEAVSNYIRKYINKELSSVCHSVGSHLYYHSRGLAFSSEFARGHMAFDNLPVDYESDFVRICTFDYSPDLLLQLEMQLDKEADYCEKTE